MIRTKIQADCHVLNLLKQTKTKQERMMKGYHFAKIYYEVKEYKIATEYLLNFLSVKENFAPAYKLLAQLYELTGADISQVIKTYQKCYDIDQAQVDVLLKICELYTKIPVDPEVAKHWVKKAEKHFPSNDIVLELKMKANVDLSQDSKTDAKDLINLYEAEVKKFPDDPTRNTKLMKLYLSAGRLDDACSYIFNVKSIDSLFRYSLAWHKVVLEVLEEYKKTKSLSDLTTQFYLHYLSYLSQSVILYISHSVNLSAAIEALWRFDQELAPLLAGPSIISSTKLSVVVKKDDAANWKLLLDEMEMQYIYLCGLVILNKSQKEHLSWRTSSELAYSCFLSSLSRDVNIVAISKLSDWLYKIACYRCSQAGHVVHYKFKSELNGQKWINKIQDDFVHDGGRRRICQILYGQTKSIDASKSCLNSSMLFNVTNKLTVPQIDRLFVWDQVVQEFQLNDLQCLVWMCLHCYKNLNSVQPRYPYKLFSNLPYSCPNIEAVSSESTCQLDVWTFLLATVRCSALAEDERVHLHDPNRPFLLPAPLHDNLCTTQQLEWWTSLHKLYTSSASLENLGQHRTILARGIEVVRLLGNHGMDIHLVVHLARCFENMQCEGKEQLDLTIEYSMEQDLINQRSQYLWKKALYLIERLLNKQYSNPPKVIMFQCRDAKLPVSEVTLKKYSDEGRYFQAIQLKNASRLEEAVKFLNNIKNSKSYYQLALIYRMMSGIDNEDNASLEDTVAEDWGYTKINLLTKAKHALNDAATCFDKDDNDFDDNVQMKIASELEEVEAKLNQLKNVNDYSNYEDNEKCCSNNNNESQNNTSFGVSKVNHTPQKPSLSKDNQLSPDRSNFLVSSTPFNKISQKSKMSNKISVSESPDFEKFDFRLETLTHFMDQRFKIIVEENQKLLERVIKLETKFQSLESQKYMWMPTMQFPMQNNMMPPHPSIPHPSIPPHPMPSYPHPNIFPHYVQGGKPIVDQVSQSTNPMFNQMIRPSSGLFGPPFPPINNPQLPQSHPHYDEFDYVIEDGSSDSSNITYKPVSNVLPDVYKPIEPGFFSKAPQQMPFVEVKKPGGPTTAVAINTLKISTPTNQLIPNFVSASSSTWTVQTSDKNMPSLTQLLKSIDSPMNTSTGLFDNKIISASLSVIKNTTSFALFTSQSMFKAPATSNLFNNLSFGNPVSTLASTSLPIFGSTQPAVTNLVVPKVTSTASQQAIIVSSDVSSNTTSSNPTLFGGLAFRTTPIIKPLVDVNDAPKTQEADKNTTIKNLFANFSFSTTSTMASVSNNVFATLALTSTQNEPKPSSVIHTSSLLVNAATPSNKSMSGVMPPPESKVDESLEEFEPVGDFKPLVSLPIVNVMTGEENDIKLFGERAKLYRMDVIAKQWKERGVGEIKLLQNKFNNKFRVLMRREQVLKVCANHYITPDMILVELQSSENSFCWFARDFAEEEMKEEQFCVRFKTKEIADKFKECFGSCLNQLKEQSTKLSNSNIDSIKEVEKTKEQKQLSEFKSKPGNWTCQFCYVKNPTDKLICSACEQQPGEAKKELVNDKEKPVVPPVSSSQVRLSELFKPRAGEWTCSSCYVKNPPDQLKCLSCESIKPGSMPTTTHNSIISKNDNVFSTPSSNISFGTQGGFTFGNMQLCSGFSSGFGNKLQSTQPSTTAFGPGFSIPSGFNIKFSGFGSTDSVPKLDKIIATTSVVSVTTSSKQQTIFTGGFAVPSSLNSKLNLSGLGANGDSGKTENLPIHELSVTITGMISTKASTIVPTNLFTSSAKQSFSFAGDNKQTVLEAKNKVSFSATDNKKTQEMNLDKSSSSNNTFTFGTPTFKFSGVISKKVEQNDMNKTFTHGSITPQSPQSPESGEMYKNQDGEDDHIYFEPIVKLPDNFQVKTGEEDEFVLFIEKAKLYRFTQNEWKERGVGEVKLLKKSESKFRLLMRREKILKICCNHWITGHMELVVMPNASNKAFIWHADDFADGDVTHEKFCIKFKTEEHAEAFKKCFESITDALKGEKNVLKQMDGTGMDSGRSDNEDCVIVHVEQPSEDHLDLSMNLQLPTNFYNYLKAPQCPGCIGCKDEEFDFSTIGQNLEVKKETDLFSTSNIFKTPIPKTSTQLLSASQQSVLPSLSSFTSASSTTKQLSTVFNLTPPKWTVSQSISKIFSTTTTLSNKSDNKFSTNSTSTFNIFAPQPIQIANSKETSTITPLFGRNAFAFTGGVKLFGSSAASSFQIPMSPSVVPSVMASKTHSPAIITSIMSATTTIMSATKSATSGVTISSSTAPIFGAAATAVIDFSNLMPTTNAFKSDDTTFSWPCAGEILFGSSKSSSKKTPVGKGDEDDDVVEPSQVDDIHFEPVVQLPEVVDLKTGEEDEEEMYRQRAVLFRFDGGQWKERGVGDMKVLRNKINANYRLLFRRDQVHKVVCNHLLTPDIKFKTMQTSEKAWCWFANDFSEGEMKLEQFAIRFKTTELAKEFKEAIDNCQKVDKQLDYEIEKGQSSQQSTPGIQAQPTTLQAESSTQLKSMLSNLSIAQQKPQECKVDNDQNEDVDDDDVDEDEEKEVLFNNRATLIYKDPDVQNVGLVDVIIIEDSDVNGYRIKMLTDDAEEVCNHIICKGYNLTKSDVDKRNCHSCTWTALDFATDDPVRKTFVVTFSSGVSIEMFKQLFNEGLKLADEQDLTEKKHEYYVEQAVGSDSTDENSQ